MRRARRTTCLLALALLLAACSGTGSDTGRGAVTTEGPVSGDVSFLVFGAPEEIKAFRDVIRGFRRVEPNVNVKLIEASDREDLLTRLSTSFAGGTPPDLFLVNYRYYAQFAAKGVLEPVEARVNASKTFKQADFYPQALDAFRFGGTLTCLPQNISSLVVYYNRSMFQQAGVAEPKTGWTWGDMVTAAKRLTRDTNGDGTPDQYGLGVEPEMIRLAPFIWSNGGQLVDNPATPRRLAVDGPEAVDALQQFLDLRRAHGITPTEAEVEAEDVEARFEHGRLGMVMSSRRSTPAFRQISGFDWDVAAPPTHRQPATVLHSDGYCMTAASDNKDAAWRFMEFALGAEGQRITAGNGRTVPSLVAVSKSEAFLDPKAKPASSKVFLDGIPVMQRLPNVSTWPEIEDRANGILEEAFYGTLRANQVADELVEQTLPLFSRARS